VKVLSLFNGMSCGMMALEGLGINVDSYYSSEIDKYANQATEALYPDIIQVGDVTKWNEWDIDFSSIDLLLAGFPCQAWSMAGNQEGDDDPRGELVHNLIRVWDRIDALRSRERKAPARFMFENVKMKDEFIQYINNLFGAKPTTIDSALVSAQMRKRLYWSNINIDGQPRDLDLCIGDIWNGGEEITERYNAKVKGTLAYEKSRSQTKTLNDKAYCLTTRGQGISNTGATNIKIDDLYFKPCVIESLRLQSIPEDKINTIINCGLSKTQIHKLSGNGWNVATIKHVLRNIAY